MRKYLVGLGGSFCVGSFFLLHLNDLAHYMSPDEISEDSKALYSTIILDACLDLADDAACGYRLEGKYYEGTCFRPEGSIVRSCLTPAVLEHHLKKGGTPKADGSTSHHEELRKRLPGYRPPAPKKSDLVIPSASP